MLTTLFSNPIQPLLRQASVPFIQKDASVLPEPYLKLDTFEKSSTVSKLAVHTNRSGVMFRFTIPPTWVEHPLFETYLQRGILDSSSIIKKSLEHLVQQGNPLSSPYIFNKFISTFSGEGDNPSELISAMFGKTQVGVRGSDQKLLNPIGTQIIELALQQIEPKMSPDTKKSFINKLNDYLRGNFPYNNNLHNGKPTQTIRDHLQEHRLDIGILGLSESLRTTLKELVSEEESLVKGLNNFLCSDVRLALDTKTLKIDGSLSLHQTAEIVLPSLSVSSGRILPNRQVKPFTVRIEPLAVKFQNLEEQQSALKQQKRIQRRLEDTIQEFVPFAQDVENIDPTTIPGKKLLFPELVEIAYDRTPLSQLGIL